MSKWNAAYLAENEGSKLVTVHVCEQGNMDFLHKNFLYKTLAFDEFVERASGQATDSPFLSKEEKYYLRSLGENPRKDVADIRKDFPELAKDVFFPELFPTERFFSSVFRIASKGVQLWTHYDIMDNLLMVISGCKKVTLFPPSDALNLYLNGDKSEVLDIENPDLGKYPRFADVTRYECVLNPGDILFIPALWFHNVLNEEWGVAVNVFWRHLACEHYDPRDVYGNKDVLPATRAMQALDRAIGHLRLLPEDYRDFYARRLVRSVEQRAYINGDLSEVDKDKESKKKKPVTRKSKRAATENTGNVSHEGSSVRECEPINDITSSCGITTDNATAVGSVCNYDTSSITNMPGIKQGTSSQTCEQADQLNSAKSEYVTNSSVTSQENSLQCAKRDFADNTVAIDSINANTS